METAFLIRRQVMNNRAIDKCHGGNGSLDHVDLLTGQDMSGRKIRHMHDNILKPGVTIGYHKHGTSEEYYLILSGQGVMIHDGERYEVGPGDLAAVLPGGSHGLENTGTEDMRIVVVGLNP